MDQSPAEVLCLESTSKIELVKPVAERFDICNYLEMVKDADEPKISLLIKNVYKPSGNFQFPKTLDSCGKLRQFKSDYLKEYPWLQYLKFENAAYCLLCVLFGSKVITNREVELFYERPLKNWQGCTKNFENHCAPNKNQNSFHQNCTELFKNHLIITEGQKINRIEPVQLRNRIIEKSRKGLLSLIDIAMLLARQGLPIRGHRDDSNIYLSLGNTLPIV